MKGKQLKQTGGSGSGIGRIEKGQAGRRGDSEEAKTWVPIEGKYSYSHGAGKVVQHYGSGYPKAKSKKSK